MPKVFLISQPTPSRFKEPPNLRPLYKHGEVVTVILSGERPARFARECMDALEQRLSTFDPETDYLVWAGGDVLSAIMVGMYLAENEIWVFNWLRYDRRRLDDGSRVDDGAQYVPVVIDLSDPDAPSVEQFGDDDSEFALDEDP